MKLMFSSLALGLGACLLLGIGIFGAAQVGLLLRPVVGREYEMWAFGGVLLVLAGVAAALFSWQDSILGWVGQLAGRSAPEIMYCQTCGTASRHDVSFCPRCSGTRFGIAKPDAAGRQGRVRVQVGMDVFASDGPQIGVIKHKRARDFLVARPLKRDLYVPNTSVARADKAAVHLSVASGDSAMDTWTRPDLLGRLSR
ncbi:MAG TPA: hypothetical protein VFN74_24820 [Chloroflexota bacterium]|nr:hypothetical protein [Chloroflexota bacterium]